MPKCTYCRADISPDNKNAFEFEAVAICGKDCWTALGMRLWRQYHNVPYDPDQLNLGVEPHDPIYDVERYIRRKPKKPQDDSWKRTRDRCS